MRKGIDCKGKAWEERKLLSAMKDITNQRFGKLIALFPVNVHNKTGKTFWLCQCDCGNKVVRSYHSLSNQTSNSCGCERARKMKETKIKDRENIIGQRFNKLTVIRVAEIRIEEKYGNERVYYECLCDCGKIVIVRGTDLKNGRTKSCGCARIDREARDREDITGQRYGHLIVIAFAYVKNKSAYWLCKCDCGGEVVVRVGDLKLGRVISCGCMKSSVGEENIKNILDQNNFWYESQYSFSDLKSDKGRFLLYDFAIFMESVDQPVRLIEFDGLQHFEPIEYFGGLEAFQTQQAHDQLKNQYALSHNIPLVRIPYSLRDTMTLEDLMGDKYLIKT